MSKFGRMRGRWMTLRAGLEYQPVTFQLAAHLGIEKYAALGRLYELASWWAEQSDYGLIKREYEIAIDYTLGKAGAARILRDAGWIVIRGDSFALAKFCNAAAIRKGVSKKLRADVLSVGQCAACGSRFKLVVDHIIPVAKGGRTTRENLQALCEACNGSKGKKSMAEVMETRRA